MMVALVILTPKKKNKYAIRFIVFGCAIKRSGTNAPKEKCWNHWIEYLLVDLDYGGGSGLWAFVLHLLLHPERNAHQCCFPRDGPINDDIGCGGLLLLFYRARHVKTPYGLRNGRSSNVSIINLTFRAPLLIELKNYDL